MNLNFGGHIHTWLLPLTFSLPDLFLLSELESKLIGLKSRLLSAFRNGESAPLPLLPPPPLPPRPNDETSSLLDHLAETMK